MMREILVRTDVLVYEQFDAKKKHRRQRSN